MASRGLFCLAVLVLAATLAEARIDKVKLNHDDRSIILVAEPFGFNENGVIEMEIGKATVFLPENSAAADKTKRGCCSPPRQTSPPLPNCITVSPQIKRPKTSYRGVIAHIGTGENFRWRGSWTKVYGPRLRRGKHFILCVFTTRQHDWQK